MPVGLVLLPVIKNKLVATDVLRVDRNNRFYEAIKALEPKPFEGKLSNHFADKGVSGIDGYGVPLTYVTAGQLVSIDIENFRQNWRSNAPAWGYLRHLEPSQQIVLWWF